jgi:hypothetical protein
MPVAEQYFTPPVVSARVAAGINGIKAGSGATPAEGSNVGAYVVLGLAGASVLGFGLWLTTREPEPRRGRRR